ncbi:hypothetical protein DSCOOX_10620 [Desulfosarcina ovata subsp. ovata]|uniref:Endo-1,3-beta-glucanase btgC n=1 Tax=Desulfosarcina ovata subsp. ovata TaxID=2752305 RepID=A0A5K8A5M0_9BACT|nr:hypothetical protein DSCOOX_10620 [Desulfosarcina ovata subsp. ovata]
MLSGLTARIRTYGNDDVLFEIPELCDAKGLDAYVGAWISSDAAANDQNISRLIQIADQGYQTTVGLIVGSEVLLRGDATEAELLAYMATVKAATGLPVSTAGTYGNYLSHEAIAEAVDFILVHIHPYWDGISVESAAQYVIDRCLQIQDAYPGKEVIIGETGWPTDGDTVGEAVPSEVNQKRFLDEFIRLASDYQITYFIFESYDEGWKIEDEGTVGGSWGLFYSDRTPKPALDEYWEGNDTGNGSSSQSNESGGGGGGGGCFITSATSRRNLINKEAITIYLESVYTYKPGSGYALADKLTNLVYRLRGFRQKGCKTLKHMWHSVPYFNFYIAPLPGSMLGQPG